MAIKPIETEYKGILFRSRTEARWAVFFETLQLNWEYETEGYVIGNRKIRYLPDFYIHNWNKYIEVKPLKEIRQEQLEKPVVFVQYEGEPLLCLFGQPWPGRYLTGLIVPCNDPAKYAPYTSALIPLEKTGQLGIAPHSNRIYLNYKDEKTPFLCLDDSLIVHEGQLMILFEGDNAIKFVEDSEIGIFWTEGNISSTRELLKIDTLLHRAYIAATRARFEFAESGKSIDQALGLDNPAMKGQSEFFNPDSLANARAIENAALKGKGDGFKFQRAYILGECISAWVQPGASVEVTRLSRGIRAREYTNLPYLSKGEVLMVIDIKTEEIFNTFREKAGPNIDNLVTARIEYDNSYHLVGLYKKQK